MASRKKTKRTITSAKYANDIILSASELGEGWKETNTEGVQLQDGPPFVSRDVRQFFKKENGQKKSQQVLMALIDYGKEEVSKRIYDETRSSLGGEHRPHALMIEDEGTGIAVEMGEEMGMSIFLFRKGTFLGIWTVWTFIGTEIDVPWVEGKIRLQVSKIL